MSKCQYMVSFCTKTQTTCPHAKYDGHCDCASCGNETVPTYQDMIDIYSSGSKATVKRIRDVCRNVRRIAELARVGLTDKVALSESEWNDIRDRLLSENPQNGVGHGYAASTVRMYLDSFRAAAGISSRDIRLIYRNRGMIPPNCDFIPTVESEDAKKIEELTLEQEQIVLDKMTELRNSKNKKDHVKFVFMWFLFTFGVRPVDIGRLKWKCLVREYDGYRFEYIPGKTRKKTGGRAAGFRNVDPSAMIQIKKFIGSPDEYVIPRHRNYRESQVTHGQYVGAHLHIRRWVNSFMRNDVGVNGHMAMYLLRRLRSKKTIENVGLLAENILLGHSPKVALASYTDATKLKFENCQRG